MYFEKQNCSFNLRYTFHYLLSILSSIFKNRDHISITGIIECINDNKIPLPEKPDEIHDLLIGLSEEFEVCGQSSHDFGEFQVYRKGKLVHNFFIVYTH